MKIEEQLKKTVLASRELLRVPAGVISDVLLSLASSAEEMTGFILSENRKDLDRMNPEDPRYDRLKLTKERIASIASEIRHVAGLPDPAGRILAGSTRPNGLKISKISVPFGVIGIIYEARPNVTFDVFSLCLKSGNGCILKGGSDAIHSNTAIVSVIREVLRSYQINPDTLALLPAGREETEEMLHGGYEQSLVIAAAETYVCSPRSVY